MNLTMIRVVKHKRQLKTVFIIQQLIRRKEALISGGKNIYIAQIIIAKCRIENSSTTEVFYRYAINI